MKELKDSTPEGHPDHKNIITSFESMSLLADNINKTKQMYEDQAQLRSIATKLCGNLGSLHDSFIFNKNVEHNWKTKSNKGSKSCAYCLGQIHARVFTCTACGMNMHEDCYKKMPPNCSKDKKAEVVHPSIIKPTRKLIKRAKLMHKMVDMEHLGDTASHKPREVDVFLMNDSLLVVVEKNKEELEMVDLVRWKSRSKNKDASINEHVTSDGLSFSISNPRVPFSHTFFLSSQQERDEWLSKIKEQIEAYSDLLKNKSRLSLQSEHEQEQLKEQLKGMVFTIPGPVPVGSSLEKHFMAYMIDMKNETGSCTILKRYREFSALHQALKKKYGEKLPRFPGKKLVGNTNAANVQKRCVKLADFLNGCMQLEGFLDLPTVQHFLTSTVGTKGEEKALLKLNEESKKERRGTVSKMEHDRNASFFLENAVFQEHQKREKSMTISTPISLNNQDPKEKEEKVLEEK